MKIYFESFRDLDKNYDESKVSHDDEIICDYSSEEEEKMVIERFKEIIRSRGLEPIEYE